MAKPLTFIDGEARDHLSSHDRGLAYGHGVFETMRLHGGDVPLLALHLERLAGGLSGLGIPAAATGIAGQLADLLPLMPAAGIVKLVVTAGVGPRGYRQTGAAPTVIVHWYPPPAASAEARLQVCRYRLPANPRLAGIKHLNRLDQVVAAMEITEPDRHGLLLDGADQVVETLGHNLFVLRDGRWSTPPLENCGVAGVMRRYLLETLLPAEGIAAEVAAIAAGDLGLAEEIFICNAVSGITPVADIAAIGHWSRHPATDQLRRRLGSRLPCFAG